MDLFRPLWMVIRVVQAIYKLNILFFVDKKHRENGTSAEKTQGILSQLEHGNPVLEMMSLIRFKIPEVFVKDRDKMKTS